MKKEPENLVVDTFVGRDRQPVKFTQQQYNALIEGIWADKWLVEEIIKFKKASDAQVAYVIAHPNEPEDLEARVMFLHMLKLEEKTKKLFPAHNQPHAVLIYKIGEILTEIYDRFITTQNSEN